MTFLLGIDIGTTTITSIAVDADTGEIVESATTSNDAKYDDRPAGRSEWDANRIISQAMQCVHDVTSLLGSRTPQIVGIGMTGQQHGMVLVDKDLSPLSPYINWQDQRGNELDANGVPLIETLTSRLGDDQYEKHGCYLRTGFMNVTLHWLAANGGLPSNSRAAFIMDLVASRLCNSPLVSDPTAAGSAGLLNIHSNSWNTDALNELNIPVAVLPEVKSVREQVGTVTKEVAATTGLPAGIPVFVPIGDNQASFLGSVANRHTQLSINVGTGGQVSAYSDMTGQHASLEVRPFPYGGFLLANVGACGGRSFAALENFFQAVARDIFDLDLTDSVYERMKELAADTHADDTGLICSPLFTGTRQDPTQRASWSGLNHDNFTPALITRSLLEGMASTFNEGFAAILSCGVTGITEIVGAGNGIRENSVLQQCIETQFNMSVRKPMQREEATLGAAITAAIGCGVLSDLSDSSRWIHYE
ncbi:MAG: hypothetical protein CMJ76_13425 [Planctomycetaceae bacterium]|nr:hypothetical protein [Planctomycetaceae bacterium]